MTRQAISTDRAPAALGPYSQAVVANGWVFCSGMTGIDPATGAAPEGIEAQTEQALINLAAVLEAAGVSMSDIVKTTIFYADITAWSNQMLRRGMTQIDHPLAQHDPARGTVGQIGAFALDLRGETEGIRRPRARNLQLRPGLARQCVGDIIRGRR